MKTSIPRRKVGKVLFSHRCIDKGTSILTATMYSGGGITADGDQISGGSDIALIVERAKDKYLKNEIRMTKSCIKRLEEEASKCGDWKKYACGIFHLQQHQTSLREQITGK